MERSYEQAVQVLKERVGERWDGGVEDQGDLARILSDGLGIPRAEADTLVESLIAAGQLRFHRSGVAAGEVGVIPGAPAFGMAGAPIGSSTGGTIGVPAAPAALSPGYWQIGSAESERGAEPIARKGQVDPTR